MNNDSSNVELNNGNNSNIELTPEQNQAYTECISPHNNIFIITGKPGTGKTTLALWIVNHYISLGRDVALSAPTGRAAKRLAEKSNRPTSTIHRLLAYNPGLGWGFNKDNPLPHDVVYVDESSMMDLFLFRRLLDALKPKAKLILTGDPYQLPPVGPGCPFKDLIRAGVPQFELLRIHRQAADSMIVQAAHAILDGRVEGVYWDGERTDFQLIDKGDDTEEILKYIETELFNAKYSYEVSRENVQVLCPQKIGDIGTKVLNVRFQSVFNPPSHNKREYTAPHCTFREDDRIIQMKNDYELGVFNGDLGYVRRIFTPDERKVNGRVMIVDFDDNNGVYIPSKSITNINLAYALTIHKSQGGEYDLVIIPCHRSNMWMWHRPLIYTAVTRAKKHCVLVGDMTMVVKAIKDTREDNRNSWLRERILGG